MRKTIILLALTTLSLASCQKEDLVINKPDPPIVSQSNMPVTFGSFSGISEKGAITVNFSTTEEKQVKYFEIFSGDSDTLLCEIKTIFPEQADGGSSRQYSFVDDAPKGNPTYYMIGYVCNNDSTYYYDPVIKVSLDQ